MVGTVTVPEAFESWPRDALDPSTYRPAIETRFAHLLEKEFATGPVSGILAWLAAKAGEGKIADLMLDALQQALLAWKLL